MYLARHGQTYRRVIEVFCFFLTLAVITLVIVAHRYVYGLYVEYIRDMLLSHICKAPPRFTTVSNICVYTTQYLSVPKKNRSPINSITRFKAMV